jgi:uncharacterized protein (DUF2126 family)
MSIHVALHHVTTYRYDRLVNLGAQIVRLRPAPHCRSRVLSYSLKVRPEKHFLNWQQDPQSNWLARLVFPEPTRELVVEVDLVAEMAVINPFDFFLEPSAEKIPFAYDKGLRHELAPYLETLPLAETPKLAEYVAGIARTPKASVDFLVEVNQKLWEQLTYVIRLEPGLQTPEETLTKRSGSCRDSAWLLVQILRHLGLAARFVSGYLIQLVADVKSLDGPSGTTVDFTDLHAWCEVYLPGAGWVGLDPTSGLFAGEGHLPLAASPDPISAAPISGLVDECEVEFEHEMSVTRIWEAPRVTKPYDDAAWDRIVEAGRAIDAQLAADDVRLTMGGEPTFVSIDDPDGEEWNTAALGPTKRLRAATLYHRLRERHAPNGLVHFGQGKWYPGEQLPRWSLNCYWRRDGEPMWRSAALIADESKPSVAVDEASARRLLEGVAMRLGLDAKYAFAAYEDVYYYLWRERRLPSNVDPLDAKLDDPLERERLARIFGQGLSTIVGHVLPIARSEHTGEWQTGPWLLRAGRCYLVPGDSALGYRLPLDAQPWAARGDLPNLQPADPAQARAPLASYADIRRQVAPQQRGRMAVANAANAAGAANASGAVDTGKVPAQGESAAWLTRTAMCAEPRDGVLYVFMPPVATLDDYLEIVAAVEASAEELGQPVMLEGYEPPSDPRMLNFRVTPDPGVIEVNIQPCAKWDDLVENTTHLYDVARESRLGTEKFMLDGRHSGTGGGNHFVLGGATVHDSPFLRRPDLLRSLVAYWHDHPSLSYLFSSLFIGPTSQAPRLDEARNDAVYEIEIAFRELDRQRARHGVDCPPWLVDRLFRNLLVDVSGNTHRAEFCIDKLFSPDSPTGRHGLLEMRNFEMPPHARMSLAQQLLIRSLVARFWRTPYAPARLSRWGTELHDRFMLPHWVWQDLEDVVDETRAAGHALEASWFTPHHEFRFPKVGDFAARGALVELRTALEPWHVMGEEGVVGGTARYVDSSLERMQVKATGLSDGGRYALTVNGVVLPMQPTGVVGEHVAGVRYRAWQPPSALHPTIGVHAPLVIDLVDRWSGRSLGGCQYHVAHPGGRNFERFPVNAYEAEGRRLARFARVGYTPGNIVLAEPQARPEHPFTLDLRRV